MNDSTESTASPVIALYDYHLAAIIIFLISSMGLVCNSLVAFFTRRMASLNNPFGRLTASQSTGEMILCAVFAFYYSPMVFFDVSIMKLYSKHTGLILLMCYSICIISHLFIALNRMIAICFPLKYDIWFSYRNTSSLIAISWTISIGVVFYLHGLEDCSLIYSDAAWVFVFKTTERCGFISWYIDFGQDFSIVVIIAIVDTITIIKVRLTSAQIAKSGCHTTTSARSRDINFLKQAVAQGVIFAVELFTYFFMGWLFTNKWGIFMCTTMAWNIVHFSDPGKAASTNCIKKRKKYWSDKESHPTIRIIIITFNKEFRRLVCSPLRRTLRSSVVIHPESTEHGRKEATRTS